MKQGSVFPRSQNWRFGSVWTDTLGNKPERPGQERGHAWASELGKPTIEIFLKMRGIEASNPPNPRAKRKFVAGLFFERFVGYIFQCIGILKDAQAWVSFQYPGLLEVTGRIDFIAGGIPDYEGWRDNLTSHEKYLLADFMDPVEAVMDHFRKKYPEGLADTYIEVKSCSSFAMNSMERTGRASKNHRLQLFHYLKAKNFPRGLIVYICRDDLRLFEVEIKNPDAEIETEYRAAIEEISKYWTLHEKTPVEKIVKNIGTESEPEWVFNPEELPGLPPLAAHIVWDDDYKKFTRNWGVEYSSYLTMLYGFKTQLEFEEVVNPTVGRWNRVLARLKKAEARKAWLATLGFTEDDVQSELVAVEGRKTRKRIPFIMVGETKTILPEEHASGHEITDKNKEVIAEMLLAGFNPEELVNQYAGDGEEEEEEA